jgi:hypothetical protein
MYGIGTFGTGPSGVWVEIVSDTGSHMQGQVSLSSQIGKSI